MQARFVRPFGAPTDRKKCGTKHARRRSLAGNDWGKRGKKAPSVPAVFPYCWRDLLETTPGRSLLCFTCTSHDRRWAGRGALDGRRVGAAPMTVLLRPFFSPMSTMWPDREASSHDLDRRLSPCMATAPLAFWRLETPVWPGKRDPIFTFGPSWTFFPCHRNDVLAVEAALPFFFRLALATTVGVASKRAKSCGFQNGFCFGRFVLKMRPCCPIGPTATRAMGRQKASFGCRTNRKRGLYKARVQNDKPLFRSSPPPKKSRKTARAYSRNRASGRKRKKAKDKKRLSIHWRLYRLKRKKTKKTGERIKDGQRRQGRG